MYLRGSRMLAAYPVSTLTPGNNLNITVMSHGEQLDVGLLAALGTLPDMDRLVEHLEARYRELQSLFPAQRPKAAKRRKASAASRGKRPARPATRKARSEHKARPKRLSKAGRSAA
jgi:hypothetical protein